MQISIEFGKGREESVRNAYNVLSEGAKIEHSYDDAEHGDKPSGARLTICHAWAIRGKSK